MGILKALSRAGALVWCPISKKIFWLCIGSVKCMPKHLCRHESWRWFDLILVAWIKFPLWKVKTLKTFLSALCWDLRVSSGYALSSAKSYELIEVNNEGWARLWSGAKDIWHPQTLGFADHHHPSPFVWISCTDSSQSYAYTFDHPPLHPLSNADVICVRPPTKIHIGRSHRDF